MWITADYLHENRLLISQWQTKRIALWSSQTGAYREFCDVLSGLTGAEVFSTASEIAIHDLGSDIKLSAGDNRLGIDSLLGSRISLA
jgi:hypothetical protein